MKQFPERFLARSLAVTAMAYPAAASAASGIGWRFWAGDGRLQRQHLTCRGAVGGR
jgi:hypothetical protein